MYQASSDSKPPFTIKLQAVVGLGVRVAVRVGEAVAVLVAL
jgi:hypothetical protein